MKQLAWSRMKNGNWNGKIGPATFFTISWHTENKGWIVASKLPGRKMVLVESVNDGKLVADKLWNEFVHYLF